MGQWSSGYDVRKSAHKSDDRLDGILGELFPLFFFFYSHGSVFLMTEFYYARCGNEAMLGKQDIFKDYRNSFSQRL
jgi:hypothetical protein